jgi:hypothetical protein
MPLTFLIDEQLRGALLSAFLQHNAAGSYPVDVVEVGGPPDLPRGTTDPNILLWTERTGRVLIARDKRTLPGHLANHLQLGHHSPGILLLRRGYTISEFVDLLVIAAYTTDPLSIRDRYEYFP